MVERLTFQSCRGVVRRIGIAVVIVAMGLAAAGLTARGSSTAPGRTVPCSESIDGTKFPYVGNRDPKYRYRLVLGAVSVPPAVLDRAYPTGTRPWTHFSKAGLVVRASGVSVTVTVPKQWRSRAGIAWGYGDKGVFSSLRIGGCHALPSQGFAFSGGFYLRSRSACVPLVFTLGRRSATVRFGVGRVCR
jgi:hypothetical protein